MKALFTFLFLALELTSGTAQTASPMAFHAALRKIYPAATNVAWQPEDGYYVATFTPDGLEREVWMDPRVDWVMTRTDVQTADRLPAAVYNAFAFSSYAGWTVEDVSLMDFPQVPSVYVITVNQDNATSTFLLLYATDGTLLQTRDVTYTSPALTPALFIAD